MPAANPVTLLTIEDDAILRRNLCAYLEDSGFRLLQAADGVEGLEVFRRERPDLVLTDLRMPGLDGLAVVTALQAESPETPVIVVSGAGQLEDAIAAVRRGAWDYVTKPIPDLAVLQLTIGRVLERARLLRENRLHQTRLEQLVEERSAQLRTAHAELQTAYEALRHTHEQLQTQHEALLAKDEALQQADQEIRRFNIELEQRVMERTAQLEAANRELEAFSYSVSHDLRGPLIRIVNFSDLLRQDYGDQLDATGQHYLERIRVTCQHLSQLIADLLSLAHVARAELSLQTVDLAAMARSLMDDLREAHPDRRVEFICAAPLLARADPTLVRTVLANLLENAWKFTAQRPAARIEAGQFDRDGRRVYFVRDDGAGFDMRGADRLFGAFQRFHSAKDFAGTGVGLATVQRVIHRHGGQVWAESAVGKGATFFFTLPG